MSKRLPHGKVARVRATSFAERKPQWMSRETWEQEQLQEDAHATIVPRILIWIRIDCRDARRRVRGMLHSTGVKVREEHAIGDKIGMVVTGSISQLQSCALSPCVLSWELCISSSGHFLHKLLPF